MSSFERESFQLLQLSESGSESIPDLDLIVPIVKRQKKKVRLKRKDRDGSRQALHAGHDDWWLSSCARLVLPPNISCEPLTFCIISSLTSLILAVAALAYFTSTLNAKINSLTTQLKSVDVGSKTIPETLQMIHTRIETLRTNQSSVLTALDEINRRVDKVTKDLESVNHSLVSNKQEDIASALRSVAELGTNVQELTHRIENTKNKSDGNEDNINKINQELKLIKLNHIDLQNGGTTTHSPPPDPGILDKLNGRVEKIENTIVVLTSRGDVLNNTITNIDTNSSTRIDWLKDDVKNLQTKIGQLEDDNNKVSSQVGSVEERCKAGFDTITANVTSLSKGLNNLEVLLNQVKNSAKQPQQQIKVDSSSPVTELTSASTTLKRPRDRRQVNSKHELYLDNRKDQLRSVNSQDKLLSVNSKSVVNSRDNRKTVVKSHAGNIQAESGQRHSRSAGDFSP